MLNSLTLSSSGIIGGAILVNMDLGVNMSCVESLNYFFGAVNSGVLAH